MSRWYYYLLCVTFLTLGLHSCTNDDDKPVYSVKYYSGKVATDWFEMVRGLTKTTPVSHLRLPPGLWDTVESPYTSHSWQVCRKI